jgi:hypothetical protein
MATITRDSEACVVCGSYYTRHMPLQDECARCAAVDTARGHERYMHGEEIAAWEQILADDPEERTAYDAMIAARVAIGR